MTSLILSTKRKVKQQQKIPKFSSRELEAVKKKALEKKQIPVKLNFVKLQSELIQLKTDMHNMQIDNSGHFDRLIKLEEKAVEPEDYKGHKDFVGNSIVALHKRVDELIPLSIKVVELESHFKRLDNLVQNHRLQPIVALVLGLVISLFSTVLVSRMSNPPIALAILFSFIASNYLATFIVDRE